MPKLFLPIALLMLSSVLNGQDAAELMRKGSGALNAGLWEMAALHYEQCLNHKDLTNNERQEVSIRLAESLVREGRPTEALALLGQSQLAAHPETPFWKGLALLGAGRLAESADLLAAVLKSPSSPYRVEAGFTLESIHLALDHPDAALAVLDEFGESSDSALTTRARLHKVEILLDMGRGRDARATMDGLALKEPADKASAALLEARLQLLEGHADDAASGFQALVDQPQNQSRAHYHLAAVGLADALHVAGHLDEASLFLLAFIQSHPDSPQLGNLFDRLLDNLPSVPSATDAILDRLAEWIPACETPFAGALAGVNSSAAAVWPAVPVEIDPLVAQAMFARALGLHRVATPEARAEAVQLLSRLWHDTAGQPLASRALFEMARWLIDDGEVDRAFGILDTLRETAMPWSIRGKAAFLEASRAHAVGDHKLAQSLFVEAASHLTEVGARTARFNAALSALSGSTAVVNLNRPEDSALAADLELERALAMTTPDAKRAALEEFLTKHPDHPRQAEARMAAAEIALTGSHPDLAFARAQLDALAKDAANVADVSPARLAWVRLRIQDVSNDSAATIGQARDFLKQYPTDMAASDAAFILGRNLFQAHNYNDARLTLEKLAASDPESPRAQAAWLLAARSAALVPTVQSQQEALTLYDKVIQSKSVAVTAVAMLEKGRLLIDMNRLVEASAFMRKWFDSLRPTDALHLPCGLLLGEAIYAQGGARPDSLQEALAVYDKLLVHTHDDPAVFNRIQYLRGRTLEQIPEAKDPTRKREKEAFIAYYSVLETTSPPAEWHYFELCGFRALSLLENAGRWPAAIACAKKIASFKGPRGEEAAAHASQLQLKHMIWED